MVALQKALANKVKGLNVDVSTDAGSYICNYMFYRANQHAEVIRMENEVDCAALFVHVPNFNTASQAAQSEFLVHLLNALPSVKFY